MHMNDSVIVITSLIETHCEVNPEEQMLIAALDLSNCFYLIL
jgi:hypothetical protein